MDRWSHQPWLVQHVGIEAHGVRDSKRFNLARSASMAVRPVTVIRAKAPETGFLVSII